MAKAFAAKVGNSTAIDGAARRLASAVAEFGSAILSERIRLRISYPSECALEDLVTRN